MSPYCSQMKISRAFFACCFVFLVSTGFIGNASASCGDYLRHRTSGLSKSFSVNEFHDGQSDKLPAPSTGCKHGNCGQMPPALPVDLVRIAKLDANHLRTEFFFAFGMMDKFESLNDKSPLQPTLDLTDPPPRTLAL